MRVVQLHDQLTSSATWIPRNVMLHAGSEKRDRHIPGLKGSTSPDIHGFWLEMFLEMVHSMMEAVTDAAHSSRLHVHRWQLPSTL